MHVCVHAFMYVMQLSSHTLKHVVSLQQLLKPAMYACMCTCIYVCHAAQFPHAQTCSVFEAAPQACHVCMYVYMYACM